MLKDVYKCKAYQNTNSCVDYCALFFSLPQGKPLLFPGVFRIPVRWLPALQNLLGCEMLSMASCERFGAITVDVAVAEAKTEAGTEIEDDAPTVVLVLALTRLPRPIGHGPPTPPHPIRVLYMIIDIGTRSIIVR